jgi:hypothetical protein
MRIAAMTSDAVAEALDVEGGIDDATIYNNLIDAAEAYEDAVAAGGDGKAEWDEFKDMIDHYDVKVG